MVMGPELLHSRAGGNCGEIDSAVAVDHNHIRHLEREAQAIVFMKHFGAIKPLIASFQPRGSSFDMRISVIPGICIYDQEMPALPRQNSAGRPGADTLHSRRMKGNP